MFCTALNLVTRIPNRLSAKPELARSTAAHYASSIDSSLQDGVMCSLVQNYCGAAVRTVKTV